VKVDVFEVEEVVDDIVSLFSVKIGICESGLD
jgi:hypothetical protein